MHNTKLLTLATATMLAGGGAMAAQKAPNVLVILIDDMGQRDASCYNSEFYQTPNIDQLAADGVMFNNGYSACTVSSPTRAALQTGKYPARLHLTDWIAGFKNPTAKFAVPDWCQYLPLEEETIAEQLKAAGYQTWHVGKWHLGDDPKYYPQNQGYDVNIGGNFKGSPNKNEKMGYKGYFAPYGLECMEEGEDGEYLTDRLTDDAVDLIERRDKDKPFFLNLCHYALHTPLDGKAEKIAKYKELIDPDYFQKNATYAAMVESVDEGVGRVIEQLKKEGIYDNTLIFFTGDNGALLGSSKAIPLRLGKGQRYEGGVRVPFIMRYGAKYAGRVSDQPVITMDIVATIQEVAGLDAQCVDGRDIMQFMRRGDYDRPLFWHYPHYHRSGGSPYSAIRVGDWKLIQSFEDETIELYNLREDVGEEHNMADEEPELRNKLYNQLQQWRDEVGAQYATPNPNWAKTAKKRK